MWCPVRGGESRNARSLEQRKSYSRSEGSLNWSREIWILVKRLLGAASRKYSGSQMIPQQAHTHGGDRGWWWVQAKKGRERATRRAQAASVHVACAASCSLPFELPLCPLRGTPPALRVWSPLPSALLFWMPRSEKACLAAARKDRAERKSEERRSAWSGCSTRAFQPYLEVWLKTYTTPRVSSSVCARHITPQTPHAQASLCCLWLCAVCACELA